MQIITKNTGQLKAEVARHIEADAVIQGKYWVERDNAVGGRGCFIGCLAHSDDPKEVTRIYGLPFRIVRVAETIFEDLSRSDAIEFFAAIPEAVGSDGKDLNLIHWQFLAQALEGMAIPESEVSTLRSSVVDGLRLLAAGGEWCESDINDIYFRAHRQLGSFTLANTSMINGVDYNAVLAIKRACLSLLHDASTHDSSHYFLTAMKSVTAARARELRISHFGAAKFLADLFLPVITDAPMIEGEPA